MRYVVLLMFFGFNAHAFDPFSIAMVVKGASDIANTASDIGGVADAFSELYSEVDTDAKISEEGQKMIDDINEVDSLAREAGYTAEDIGEIGAPSVDEAKKLENAIRSITKAVRASKRTMRLFQRIERKAQNAQIETAQIEKEQLAQLYKIAQEEQASNLAQIKKDLRSQIDRNNTVKGMRDSAKKKGAKWFKGSGALAFPKSEPIVESAISVSKKLRIPLMSLMLAIFLARLVYYQIGFESKNAYGDLVRDVMVCSFLLLVYPDLVRAVLSFSFSLAESISKGSTIDIDARKIILPKIDGVSQSFISYIVFGWEMIKLCAFFIVDFLVNFGLGFMVMIFPIVIFFSQMMNFAVAWPIFLGSFAVIALWPVFWNLVGVSAELVWTNRNSSFIEGLYSALLSILQLFSPILGFKLLSGSGVKDSITSSVMPIASGVATVASGVSDFKDGLNSSRSNESGDNSRQGGASDSGGFGRMLGSGAGSILNRMKSEGPKEKGRSMGENYSNAHQRNTSNAFSDYYGNLGK